MFKLVVLCAFVAVAVAKPGYYGHGAPIVAVHAAPAIVAAPIVEKVVAVPAAVSHTYRKDIISEPVVAAYAAHAVPVVAKTVVAAPYAYGYDHAGLHDVHGLHGLHGLEGYGHHW